MANRWAPFIDQDTGDTNDTISSASFTTLGGLSLAITAKIDTRLLVCWSFVAKCNAPGGTSEFLEVRLHDGAAYVLPHSLTRIAADEVVTVSRQVAIDLSAGATKTLTLRAAIQSYASASYVIDGTNHAPQIQAVGLPLQGVSF